MNLCFLLHFYQPSNQFGEVVKKVARECYVPLIKSIKNDKRIKITANFPLSLLEQLDRYGFNWLICDIKELVDAGRVELVGSAAYHPLLTKIPRDFIDKQTILNEISLAYYFGSNKDFEGEDCFMIKGVKGFFPPEMAINLQVLEDLKGLGYEWVSVDEFCLPKDLQGRVKNACVYSLSTQTPRLVVRNRGLTDLISFKRDSADRSAIVAEILKDSANRMVALDAETFGHHYKDGIHLFESMVSDIFEKGIELSTISEMVQESEVTNVARINESTWSSTEKGVYPLWENTASEVNTALWFLQREIHAEFVSKYPLESQKPSSSQSGGMPVWRYKYDARVPPPDLRTRIELDMLKLQQSDQFWWSAEAEVMGRRNFSKYMVDSVLDYYVDVVEALGSNKVLIERIASIRSLLKD